MNTLYTFPTSRMWFKTATDEAQGIVDAIVNTTSLIDRQKDIVHPGAFRNALAGKMPKVVNSHDGTKFLGKVLSMRELMPGDPTLPVDLRAQGLGALAVTMRFNLETQDGREMFSNIRGGYVDQWSFFFSIEDAQYDAKGIRHIKMIDEIFEVSPVLVGANQATLTLAAKAGRASTAISGYCLKDKQLVRIQNPRAVTMKDGSGATRGSCPHCGTRVYASTLTGIEGARKILRRDAATTAAEQAGKHALWEMWLRGEIGGPVAMPDDIKPQKWPSADGVRHDIRF